MPHAPPSPRSRLLLLAEIPVKHHAFAGQATTIRREGHVNQIHQVPRDTVVALEDQSTRPLRGVDEETVGVTTHTIVGVTRTPMS